MWSKDQAWAAAPAQSWKFAGKVVGTARNAGPLTMVTFANAGVSCSCCSVRTVYMCWAHMLLGSECERARFE